jgi:hypothetical protein
MDLKEDEKIYLLKLSELCYSLSEYEIISEIFNEKMSLNVETSRQLNQAIEFETEDKFREVSLIYLDLIYTRSPESILLSLLLQFHGQF